MAQLTPDFFQKILKIEGGYQDIPKDVGNYCGNQLIGTKYGVSAVALGTWWGRCPTVAEMKGFTKTDAYNFYAWYFNEYNLFQVDNQQFAELLMNNTMGSPFNAAKVEQRILNQYGYDIQIDGVRGPLTIEALNAAYQKHGAKLYNDIRTAWVNYLISLNRPQFIDGWLRRMNQHFPLLTVAAASTGGILGIAVILYLIFSKKRT